MDKKLIDTFIEVFEVLMPTQAELDSYEPKIAGRFYNLGFFITGLLAGSRISAAQLSGLVDKLPKQPVETPGEAGVAVSSAPQGQETAATPTPGKKKEGETQEEDLPRKFSA